MTIVKVITRQPKGSCILLSMLTLRLLPASAAQSGAGGKGQAQLRVPASATQVTPLPATQTFHNEH